MGIVAGLVVLVLLGLQIRRRTPAWVVERWELTVAKTTPKNKFKIVLGFYMIATKVSGVYDVSLPADVRAVLERLTVVVSFGMGGVATTPLECVGLAGYVPRILFWMILPVVLTLIILVGVGLSMCLKKKKSSGSTRAADDEMPGPRRASTAQARRMKRHKSDANVHGMQISLEEEATDGPARGSTLIENALPPFLQIMFLLYPLVTNVAFVSSQALEPQSLLVL